MVIREGEGMDTLGRGFGRGGVPAPSYSLRWPEYSFQMEWAFVQRVTPHTGEAFRPVEEALDKSLLPDLFKVSTADVLP